jgi:pyridoxamine 5'-phosphate oxidase like protein
VRDRQKIEELWNPIYKAWFPKGLEDPDLALLKVEVQEAEYWDTPSGKMVQLIGFVKAIATGESYKSSKDEHDKLDLNENRDQVA